MTAKHPVVNRPVSAYVQFADECDRRFEISEAMSAFASGADPRYKLTVSRDRILPGPDTMDSDGAWIDDPESVMKTWTLRRKAFRGDGEAMVKLAETADSYTEPIMVYVYYMMAADCLLSGKLRTEAKKRAKKTLSTMPQYFKDKFNYVLELNRGLSDRVGLPCRP